MTIAFISHPACLLHTTGLGHPECPERLTVIADAVAKSSLAPFIRNEEAPLVSLEQLQRVHDANYIDHVFQSAPLDGLVYLDPDTAMGPSTLSAARSAAGSVVRAVDLVLSNQVQAAFCNIRPPGHHAERARAMGFCLFNNIAVGVAHALEHHHVKRVAIIDFDAHRGNGTEDIFQNNKKVLICSIYEQLLYPFDEGQLCAENIINIPLPSGATGREFRAEITQHGIERIKKFKPDLLFFSAGFDGHKDDPLSTLNLTEFDYLWITSQMREIATSYGQARMVSVLEGGYSLSTLGPCVVSHLSGF